MHFDFFDALIGNKQGLVGSFLQFGLHLKFGSPFLGRQLLGGLFAGYLFTRDAILVDPLLGLFRILGRNAVAEVYLAVLVDPSVQLRLLSSCNKRSEQQDTDCD